MKYSVFQKHLEKWRHSGYNVCVEYRRKCGRTIHFQTIDENRIATKIQVHGKRHENGYTKITPYDPVVGEIDTFLLIKKLN